MENFTPVSSIIGGSLIGASAVLLLWWNGKIAGISGIFHGAIDKGKEDSLWRWLFLLGLLVGAGISVLLGWVDFELRHGYPVLKLCIAGFLVGFGTHMANGCTSGHGICGLARLSRRSMIAVLIFMASAMLTVFLGRYF